LRQRRRAAGPPGGSLDRLAPPPQEGDFLMWSGRGTINKSKTILYENREFGAEIEGKIMGLRKISSKEEELIC